MVFIKTDLQGALNIGFPQNQCFQITTSVLTKMDVVFAFFNILSILLILPKLILQIKNRTNPGITIYYIQIIIE